MTSSITRSSRSSVKKVTAPTIDINKVKPSASSIKKKQRLLKDADLVNQQQYVLIIIFYYTSCLHLFLLAHKWKRIMNH